MRLYFEENRIGSQQKITEWSIHTSAFIFFRKTKSYTVFNKTRMLENDKAPVFSNATKLRKI